MLDCMPRQTCGVCLEECLLSIVCHLGLCTPLIFHYLTGWVVTLLSLLFNISSFQCCWQFKILVEIDHISVFHVSICPFHRYCVLTFNVIS